MFLCILITSNRNRLSFVAFESFFRPPSYYCSSTLFPPLSHSFVRASGKKNRPSLCPPSEIIVFQLTRLFASKAGLKIVGHPRFRRKGVGLINAEIEGKRRSMGSWWYSWVNGLCSGVKEKGARSFKLQIDARFPFSFFLLFFPPTIISLFCSFHFVRRGRRVEFISFFFYRIEHSFRRLV